MDNKSKLGLTAVIFGLTVALGPATGGFFVGKAIERFKTLDRSVTVKGLVEREVQADLAMWEIVYKRSGEELKAVEEQFAHDKLVILDFLRKKGFSDSEIQLQPSRVVDMHAREYGSHEGSTARYILEGIIMVRSLNVELIQKANSESDELIKAGVILASERNYQGNPRYYFTKFNELRKDMLREATRNARGLAEQFAADSGAKVGSIRSADQGVFRIMSIEGENDSETKTREKKIRVVSTLVFSLEG